jgi:hypothetical protein
MTNVAAWRIFATLARVNISIQPTKYDCHCWKVRVCFPVTGTCGAHPAWHTQPLYLSLQLLRIDCCTCMLSDRPLHCVIHIDCNGYWSVKSAAVNVCSGKENSVYIILKLCVANVCTGKENSVYIILRLGGVNVCTGREISVYIILKLSAVNVCTRKENSVYIILKCRRV